jgi:hypothetical protein
LQQLRYMHQWFRNLTTGFTYGASSSGPVDESWTATLARHNNTRQGRAHGGVRYDVLLPKVRVTEPKAVNADDGQPNVNELTQGEVTYDHDDAPVMRWWLILYGFDRFSMNQKVRVPDGDGGLKREPVALLPNRLQFWRVHTIWHEFTHAVINMALNRLYDLDLHEAWVKAKDLSTSGRIHEVILDVVDPAVPVSFSGGWSTLEEALAAVPEAALMRKVSGSEPTWSPTRTSNPRHLVMDRDAVTGLVDHVLDYHDFKLNDGPKINLNKENGLPAMNDRRIGLRVPIAFTWALWTALEQVAAFDRTLEAYVTGSDPVNDLSTEVPYLLSNGSRQVFQSLFWGPLVSSRTADIAGTPKQWNDLTAAAPAPTTFSFITNLENNYWFRGLGATDRSKIRDLFGAADSPESYYLWFTFP